MGFSSKIHAKLPGKNRLAKCKHNKYFGLVQAKDVSKGVFSCRTKAGMWIISLPPLQLQTIISSWINHPTPYRIVIKQKSKMSSVGIHQLTKETTRVPKIAVGLLLGVLLFGTFMVGFDQRHLFSVVQGEQAYEDLWMHEFYHDMGHAAGFPCH